MATRKLSDFYAGFGSGGSSFISIQISPLPVFVNPLNNVRYRYAVGRDSAGVGHVRRRDLTNGRAAGCSTFDDTAPLPTTQVELEGLFTVTALTPATSDSTDITSDADITIDSILI